MTPFAAVGFPMPGHAFDALVERVWNDGHQVEVRPRVVQADWAGTSGAGIEVFVMDGKVVYTKPTFRGKPGAVARPSEWDASGSEWHRPLRIKVLGETEYPAVVEVDDTAVARRWLREGRDYDASLALFVREQAVRDDRVAAPRAAVALESWSTEILLSGQVLSAERRVNELTGGAFGHARVASLSADYDVLFADVEPLPERGETVRVRGWLFANFRRPPGTR